jgi:hypothetical protein
MHIANGSRGGLEQNRFKESEVTAVRQTLGSRIVLVSKLMGFPPINSPSDLTGRDRAKR